MTEKDKEAPKEQPKFKEETIEIIKGGKPRKVRVRIIPIEWEGKEEEVIIKKLSFGERALYGEKFVDIKIKGEFQDVSVSIAQMQIQAILTATHKAPFPITEDYVTHELDCEIGEKIHKEVENFNKLMTATKKKLDGPSSTEPKTSK